MNKWIVRAGALLAFISLTGGAAIADAKKGEKPTPCPICKMPLSAKKTKDNPVAVKLTKTSKVMYCCDKCKMPESVLVKTTTKKPMKKGKM